MSCKSLNSQNSYETEAYGNARLNQLLLLLKDNPSFNEIRVGAPSHRNVSMD